MERKVILYIAASLDGYIASPDDNLDFLSVVEQEGEDYGYTQFTETVDTVIVGRKTYDKVLSMGFDFPHNDKESYIITRTPKRATGKVQFYTEDIKTLILKLKEQEGKNIFVDGGAEVVNLLLRDNLIDEFCISIIPVLLGNGIRLFQDNRPALPLKFVRSETFKSGLVQVWYKKA